MKAIGYYEQHPIDDDRALVDLDIARPEPGPGDILVRVEAISVNPVDYKVRQRAKPDAGTAKILGWDVAGVVETVGRDVTAFSPGDAVWYAGDITRPGGNAQFHAVDARLAGRKPKSIDFAAAAALPLTTITAWEMLFDRFAIKRESGEGVLLLVGAAGGVGSIALQLARRLTGLTVVATASRKETAAWCTDLGAHHLIDHAKPWRPQFNALGLAGADYVFGLTHTAEHLVAIADILQPQGRFGVIDDPPTLDVVPLKSKSISIHWELMFTRSLCKTPDMAAQGEVLNEAARLVDAGVLRSTMTRNLGTINAANLRQAHGLLESGKTIGKIVLAGWD